MKKITALILCVVLSAGLLTGFALAEEGLSNFKPVNDYAPGTFTDLDESYWGYSGVTASYELGLIRGNSDSTFGAEGNVKVCEVVALAARLHSIYHTGGENFAQGDPWYQVYYDYAVENGIISKGQYLASAENAAFRYQVAEIMDAALPAAAMETINSIPYGSIPDVDATSAGYIYRLYRAGILTGKTQAGDFCPSETVLRGEIAAMTARMAKPELRVRFSISQEEGPADGIVGTIRLAYQSADGAKAQFTEAYNSAKAWQTANDPTSKALYYLSMRNALEKAGELAVGASDRAAALESQLAEKSEYKAVVEDLVYARQYATEAGKLIVLLYQSPSATADWTTPATYLDNAATVFSRALNNAAKLAG